MGFISPLFLGFVTALLGVFPPGLINMTAAKISVQEGKTRAMLFTVGAIIIVFFQTLVSLLFARYIAAHQEVVVLLREIGFGIFTLLTLYFFFIAKKPKQKKENELEIKSKRSQFFLGMLISALNFFPIPFYALVSVSLSSFHYFTFDTASIYCYVVGVVLGSFAVFYAYIAFFKRIESKTSFLTRNMNNVIGSITGIMAFLTLYHIVKYYFKL
jgi:threonine/homoserine/homoserine lactone efflux protein